jgi:CRISPR-associated endoribonuclease Cas6
MIYTIYILKNIFMRFRLSFAYPALAALPINYNYAIASWIYSVIEQSDPQFSASLHEQGYSSAAGKRFRLFTFGELQGTYYRVPEAQQIVFTSSQVTLEVSFYLPTAFEHFIAGIFQAQTCEIRAFGAPPLSMRVEQVTALPKPTFQPTMRYSVLTQICVSRQNIGERHAQYLHPDENKYKERLIENLLGKYESAHPDLPRPIISSTDFEVLTEPRSKLITIKEGKSSETKIRGFKYDFRITMPVELQELAYFAGFGEKNGEGFGFVAAR